MACGSGCAVGSFSGYECAALAGAWPTLRGPHCVAHIAWPTLLLLPTCPTTLLDNCSGMARPGTILEVDCSLWPLSFWLVLCRCCWVWGPTDTLPHCSPDIHSSPTVRRPRPFATHTQTLFAVPKVRLAFGLASFSAGPLIPNLQNDHPQKTMHRNGVITNN